MQAHRKSPHRKHVHEGPWTAPVICIECGGRAKQTNGKTIYPHRPDLWRMRFWQCQCGAYVGCHRGSTKPLGSPASTITRDERRRAHLAFDQLWKKSSPHCRFSKRTKAYAWLAERMGIGIDECHIGMFSAAKAREVVRHCRELLKGTERAA